MLQYIKNHKELFGKVLFNIWSFSVLKKNLGCFFVLGVVVEGLALSRLESKFLWIAFCISIQSF